MLKRALGKILAVVHFFNRAKDSDYDDYDYD